MKKIGRGIAALSVLAMLFTTFSCANPVDPETAKKVIDDLNGDGEKDKEKEDSGEVVIGEKNDESGTSKVGIELKVTIPAHSKQYSIFRWDTAQPEKTNTEVYRMKNESDEPIEVTFFDRYGILKNHTYKYCTENNWSGRSKWKYEVTAKENGWKEPSIKIAPMAKFEDNSIVYTQQMELTYHEGASYDFAFMQAYVRENPWWMVEGAKEDEGPFFDYAFGFYPHYSGSEKKGKYNLIPDELRGLELTLTDQTLFIEIDENRVVEYIKHYAPAEFEFPQKIYAQNDVKENDDELCFTVPVPAGTHNVSLMKWDSDLNDYFEIASKPYPDKTPLENAEQIILKDIFHHKAGEESHYFIAYDGWKRYDGYDEGNREDRRGIVFTPKNNGRACRDLTNIAATYKENIITLTAEPIEENEDDYWLIFDYCDADYPDNEKARVSIWFYKGIVARGEKPDLLKANNALMDGQKLQLRTLRYNYHDKENGVDYHLALPLSNYDVPKTVTITKSDLEYNKIETVDDTLVITKPLFTCEYDKSKKLKTNEISFSREKNEESWLIVIDSLGEYQVAEVTVKGGNLKNDEENVIAPQFDKSLTYNSRRYGNWEEVTEKSKTVYVDIPQGIGIDTLIFQNKWKDDGNPDTEDWEKDFSFFIEKIVLKKDASKVPYKVTTTTDSYVIENPPMQVVWHSEVDNNKVSFKSEGAKERDGNDYTAVYWEFADLDKYDKAIITLKGEMKGAYRITGYSPYNYNSTEDDMKDYHTGITFFSDVVENPTKTYTDLCAVSLRDLKNNFDKPFKALEFINNAWENNELKDWDFEVEKIELYKISDKEDKVIFNPSDSEFMNGLQIHYNSWDNIISPEYETINGKQYLKVTSPKDYMLDMYFKDSVDVSGYMFVKAQIYNKQNNGDYVVNVILRDNEKTTDPLRRIVDGAIAEVVNGESVATELIAGDKVHELTAFIQDTANNYALVEGCVFYIGKIIATTKDYDYNPFNEPAPDTTDSEPYVYTIDPPLYKYENGKVSGNTISFNERSGARFNLEVIKGFTDYDDMVLYFKDYTMVEYKGSGERPREYEPTLHFDLVDKNNGNLIRYLFSPDLIDSNGAVSVSINYLRSVLDEEKYDYRNAAIRFSNEVCIFPIGEDHKRDFYNAEYLGEWSVKLNRIELRKYDNAKPDLVLFDSDNFELLESYSYAELVEKDFGNGTHKYLKLTPDKTPKEGVKIAATPFDVKGYAYIEAEFYVDDTTDRYQAGIAISNGLNDDYVNVTFVSASTLDMKNKITKFISSALVTYSVDSIVPWTNKDGVLDEYGNAWWDNLDGKSFYLGKLTAKTYK